MHEAVLAVFSEPGPVLPLEEFTRWYDEEHVPMRMSTFPEFLTGARYQASDGKQPSFAAFYDISSFALFEQPKYINLRTDRSPRESRIFAEIGTIDRRTYKCLEDKHPGTNRDYYPFVLTVESSQVLDDLKSELERLPGWKRSRTCHLVDFSVTGSLQVSSTDSTRLPAVLLIVDFDNQNENASIFPLLDLKAKNLCGENFTVRTWKLLRFWENSSQP
ncbi:hypothetical protein O181_066386 [Austropuccinia psidii MF-1]|uniref:Uncharacterized protein n=1 Tax=Austropuccinia psidii MF-1 TaxID=1389203 RepID=A0A9Q3EXK2_9BASI|nr:hypothetical protein [Austropuccinia psidii MF-1]